MGGGLSLASPCLPAPACTHNHRGNSLQTEHASHGPWDACGTFRYQLYATVIAKERHYLGLGGSLSHTCYAAEASQRGGGALRGRHWPPQETVGAPAKLKASCSCRTIPVTCLAICYSSTQRTCASFAFLHTHSTNCYACARSALPFCLLPSHTRFVDSRAQLHTAHGSTTCPKMF